MSDNFDYLYSIKMLVVQNFDALSRTYFNKLRHFWGTGEKFTIFSSFTLFHLLVHVLYCFSIQSLDDVLFLFSIENLFFNMPLRRESLSNHSEEFNRISSLVTKYALHYFNVSFSFRKLGESNCNSDFRPLFAH